MNKETERLVNQVKKELQLLKKKIEEKDNPKLLKTYRKMRSALD